MTFLIVDDDGDKRRLLTDFVKARYPDSVQVERESYQSGCEAAINLRPEVVLLDMSLPTFDVVPSEGETGGRQRPYGGRDVLREVARMELPAKVIIVTQYDAFGEGEESMSRDELSRRLAEEFAANYVATVFFQSSSSTWKADLTVAIEAAKV